MRGLFVALFMLLACHVSQAQTQSATMDESQQVRQAVQSYLDTTRQNTTEKNPIASNVVHPQAKVISILGDELSIKEISRKPVHRKGEPVKIESTDEIMLVDVTGSKAVVKVETVYPYGYLSVAEYNSLPENDPLRSSTGKPRKLTSYLSLLKLGGDWKIVSFLISADIEGDK
jgi:hypothetical protein